MRVCFSLAESKRNVQQNERTFGCPNEGGRLDVLSLVV